MNRLSRVTLAALIAITTFGCALPLGAAKAPVINSISPSSVAAGGAGFVLTVNGSNFNGNSVVLWNGSPRVTVMISSTQLQGMINSADIAAPGTVQISVVDPKPFPQQSNSTSLTINLSALAITTSSLPTAMIQQLYIAAVGQSGGVSPYSWKVSSGQLPPGLALDSTSGAVWGTPGQTGNYGFTTQVIDSSPTPQTASRALAISVSAPSLLSINTTTLASGAVQVAYSATLAASGGTSPYSWSISSGALPSGLSLNASTGVVAGAPTQAGTFPFTVKVTDASSAPQWASQQLAINVAATVVPLSINTPALPGGIMQTPYPGGALSASGGTTPYTWSVASGSLPPGLNLNASTGAITGTPTATGTFTFTAQAKDSSPTPQTASASASAVIVAQLRITTTSLPIPQLQTSYSVTLGLSGGMPPYVWSVSSGSLPPGLTLNSSTGAISGVPTTAGSYMFTVQVSDPPSIPQTATAQLTASVPAATTPLQITSSSLPGGQVSVSYQATLAASGGTTPYSWSVVSGALPSGLTLQATTGQISGTPSLAGSFGFILQVKDSAGQSASSSFSISILSPALTSTSSTAAPYTSRTDLNAAPETIPTLCSPAPCKMTSSDLNANLTYTRVTDSSVTPFPTDVFGTLGSAEQREWYSDNSGFYIYSPNHGMPIFYTFNPSTQTANKVRCTFTGNNCWNGILINIQASADGPMSGVSPHVFYGLFGTQIQKQDFDTVISSGGSSADTVTSIANASATTGIPTTTNGNLLSGSRDDTRFVSAFGSGGQDRWSTVWAYDTVQQGGRWFDNSNFTVGGNWGPTGNATYIDESGTTICSGSGCSNVGGTNYECSQIHNVRISPDGRWARITSQCSPDRVDFWDIATSNVYRSQSGINGFQGGGHIVTGFNNVFLSSNTDYAGHWMNKIILPVMTAFTYLINNSQPSDTHLNWDNQTSGNLQPVIASDFQTSAPTAALQDEIVGVSTDGAGTVWRFAHMFTRATTFQAQGIAHASPDGKWTIFCSDWGGGARYDVFLVPLR